MSRRIKFGSGNKIVIDAWGCLWVILAVLVILYIIGGIKVVITKGNSAEPVNGLKNYGVQTNTILK